MEIGEISKEEKRVGKWEAGKKRKYASSSGGWYASGQGARPLMTGESSVEGVPHTLTVRPESPRPAQLTCCPVEAAVAFTLSAGRVLIQADTPVITRGVWASRAGWKR